MRITISILGQIVMDTIEIATTHDLDVEIKHVIFTFCSFLKETSLKK